MNQHCISISIYWGPDGRGGGSALEKALEDFEVPQIPDGEIGMEGLEHMLEGEDSSVLEDFLVTQRGLLDADRALQAEAFAPRDGFVSFEPDPEGKETFQSYLDGLNAQMELLVNTMRDALQHGQANVPIEDLEHYEHLATRIKEDPAGFLTDRARDLQAELQRMTAESKGSGQIDNDRAQKLRREIDRSNTALQGIQDGS